MLQSDSSTSAFNCSHWMIDSGCTDHLSSFIDDFIHLGDQKQTASVANGNKVFMYGPDIILIQQINGGFKPPTVSLEEVWYVPDSLHHLLSVLSLTHHDYHCEITNARSWIWDKRGHMVIQATVLSPANNLHWFQLEMITPMTDIETTNKLEIKIPTSQMKFTAKTCTT